jgi:uroporphyrinogen III methyltransferase/synthase
MQDESTSSDLIGRTVLIAPSAARELAAELERLGARVVTWPEIEISDPESFTALDEAIEDLFGYDWLLFLNAHAAEFFLRRFHDLRHETSELDALRVCANGEATAKKLEEYQVHIDLIPAAPDSQTAFAAIESYAGGRNANARLNFLVPRASAERESLFEMLEDSAARVDVVTTYRTVAANTSALTQLNALLAGGGIDCVVFTGPETVTHLAQLLYKDDLSKSLMGAIVACIDEATSESATKFGLGTDPISKEPFVALKLQAIVDRFTSAAEKDR